MKFHGREIEAPKVGVVLGSGLGAFGDELDNSFAVPYSELADWPQSTAVGHAGKLVFGSVGGTPVAVLSGRVHLYEGYSAQQVTYSIRKLAQLGITSLIVTNAAGGINLEYSRGALVLISDHINLQGTNPLIGPNDDELGPRFPDMTEAYSRRYREIAVAAGAELGIFLKEGIYAGLPGPSYETPAEIRYLRTIGADLVGMSTVPEVIVANHMGISCLGISTVTNMAAGMTGEKLNHEEVLETGREVREKLVRLLKAVIPRIAA